MLDQTECDEIFSEVGFKDYDVDLNLAKQVLPYGFTNELACVAAHDADDFAEVIREITVTMIYPFLDLLQIGFDIL